MASMTIPGEETLVRYGYVGRTRLAPRRFDYVFLDIRMYHRDREAMTINHEPTGRYQALSISATVWATRTRRGDCHSAGQCINDVAAVEEANGALTGAELSELVKVWRRWHLNDMRQGCVHQTRPTDPDAWRSVPPCPVDGYRYGYAWLVEPLPAETEQFVRAMAAKLTAQ
jgi:hypothetical protein